MRKILLSIFGTIAIITISFSQEYENAIGLRGGLSTGITARHFLTKNTSVEGIAASRWSGFNITGLYEIYQYRAFDVKRLNWYYGGGAHIGFWNGNNVSWLDDNKDYTILGIDGIIGIEYNIKEIPVNISVDWKPAFNLIGHTGLWPDGGAVSVRYIF
ncbi:MAG: hypothetical protein JEZ09_13690 [Salinivirgaceae bacterium]|nr:hypothetical protein [Salinivirgaceae bacterium]